MSTRVIVFDVVNPSLAVEQVRIATSRRSNRHVYIDKAPLLGRQDTPNLYKLTMKKHFVFDRLLGLTVCFTSPTGTCLEC